MTRRFVLAGAFVALGFTSNVEQAQAQVGVAFDAQETARQAMETERRSLTPRAVAQAAVAPGDAEEAQENSADEARRVRRRRTLIALSVFAVASAGIVALAYACLCDA